MLLTKVNECTGCTACFNICPRKAITLQSNKEGFLFPVVDSNLCIDCNLCNQVCPVLNIAGNNIPLALFALKNRDTVIREKSSSGGVFYELAKKIINEEGIVYGAKFDENWNVYHAPAEKMENLNSLMKSKYAQSNLGNTFNNISSLLKKGKKILFVGTPCQVSGLSGYLRSMKYDNCILVELCCHGVPSPLIWRKYLTEEFNRPSVKSINFRSKRNGWQNYSLEIENRNGSLYCKSKGQDPYMRGFLYGLSMRPSCFNCPNKPFKSSADIVIGDFWGVDVNHHQFNDGNGVSQALAMTQEGMVLLNEIKKDCDSIEITWADATSVNGNYLKSTPVSKSRRQMFWFCQCLGLSVKQSVKFALMDYPHRIIKRKLKKICKKLL